MWGWEKPGIYIQGIPRLTTPVAYDVLMRTCTPRVVCSVFTFGRCLSGHEAIPKGEIFVGPTSSDKVELSCQIKCLDRSDPRIMTTPWWKRLLAGVRKY